MSTERSGTVSLCHGWVGMGKGGSGTALTHGPQYRDAGWLAAAPVQLGLVQRAYAVTSTLQKHGRLDMMDLDFEVQEPDLEIVASR